MGELLLALDAGTTSIRALLIEPSGRVVGQAKQAAVSSFPAPGRVEQDADAIWRSALQVMQAALQAAGRTGADLAAIAVTTQRASLVVWERPGGAPAGPVIVWSDLRGVDRARELREAGFLVVPQFPAAKLEAALGAALDGGAAAPDLLWGTLDSYLVWRLSGGEAHVTDPSNAWLSGYLDFARPDCWNAALAAHQGLPDAMFPRLVDSWGEIGRTTRTLFGVPVPITAIIADQQAGMVAHDALAAGRAKATFGTSAVLMVSTGEAPAAPHGSMPPEVLARASGRLLFAYEGMVITWGAFLEWMSTGLGLFSSPEALIAAAGEVADAAGVAVRPSLQGLGAPHGRLELRGAIAGLSPGADRRHLARAALEGLAFRMREIVDTVDPGRRMHTLPVDGGGVQDLPALQLLADLTGRAVKRHAVREATAYGAAAAAGLGVGLLAEADLAGLARYDCTVEPRLPGDAAAEAFERWRTIIGA